MCSNDTSVDCSCLMMATSSSQCSLTNVCDAASSATLVFSRVVLMKFVRNGDCSAKYLSDLFEKSPG
jgi:hypothetical protein